MLYPNLLKEICKKESIKFTQQSIDELVFISDKDIRKSINNLECIKYTHNDLTVDNIYKLLDKPKPAYIRNILDLCLNNKFKESIPQEFERFMRDEMNDSERKSYLRSERYKSMVKRFSEILIEKTFEK